MSRRDDTFRSNLKSKPVSTEAIKVGESNCKAKMVILERIDFPTGMESWANIYLAFRTKNTKQLSKPKLSLRKYQHRPEGWVRRQTYNVNSIKEAKVILALLLKWFPELSTLP